MKVAEIVRAAHAHARARNMRACFLLNGGVQTGSWLLTVAGGSASVLETTTAYSSASLHQYLGTRSLKVLGALGAR